MCETLAPCLGMEASKTFSSFVPFLFRWFFDGFLSIFHPRLVPEFQAVTRVPQYVTGRHQAWDLLCTPFRSGCEAPADAAVLCGNPGCYKKSRPFGNGLYHPLIGFTVLEIWNEAQTTLPVNLKWSTTSIQSIQSLLRSTKTWWKFMINSHWFQTKFMVTWTRLQRARSITRPKTPRSCSQLWLDLGKPIRAAGKTTGLVLLGTYDSWDFHIKWLPLSHFDDLTIAPLCQRAFPSDRRVWFPEGNSYIFLPWSCFGGSFCASVLDTICKMMKPEPTNLQSLAADAAFLIGDTVHLGCSNGYTPFFAIPW